MGRARNPTMTLASRLTKQLSTFTPVLLAFAVGVLATAQVLDQRTSYADGSSSPGTTSRLYLGQSTRDGDVTESQWRAFVADAVAPRFPAGFTELKADGHWRDEKGMAFDERTRIVEIAHD